MNSRQGANAQGWQISFKRPVGAARAHCLLSFYTRLQPVDRRASDTLRKQR